MTLISSHLFLLNNGVIWAIFILAIVCYALLIELCFIKPCCHHWQQKTHNWSASIKILLSSLPLLGLLGTISGLLKTFEYMTLNNGFAIQELLSGGIAEALFTTQLGLVMVIPGLLMFNYLQRRMVSWQLEQSA
ncbi:MotA/TolQ/ExbB proton channel family protein [Paraglaciecola hydrolytica]|uniref:Transporter n=1 Tax=Paraglaciecola hydrolytica TaxID=1799789 RepID=A0A148KLY7_9ALTE|nr:MotA/TolQ/ExbB proton channel family protein [Paraglaciecola hydrolytica]KXI27300.1 transporter [Paraglaciecola hydrolytica]